jgi:hypothetical protein
MAGLVRKVAEMVLLVCMEERRVVKVGQRERALGPDLAVE